MTMFSIHRHLQAHMSRVVYYHHKPTHTNMCISTTNFCQLFHFLRFWMNTSVKHWTLNRVLKKTPQFIWFLFYYLMICRTHMCGLHCCITKCLFCNKNIRHVCCSLLYYWVLFYNKKFAMYVLRPKVWSMEWNLEVSMVFFLFYFVNAF